MTINCLPLAATGLQPVQEEYPRADRWLRRLCLAILTDVLKDLEGFGGPGGRIAIARARYGHEAWDWVLSDAWYFFSFSVVCTVLDLNMEAVRGAKSDTAVRQGVRYGTTWLASHGTRGR